MRTVLFLSHFLHVPSLEAPYSAFAVLCLTAAGGGRRSASSRLNLPKEAAAFGCRGARGGEGEPGLATEPRRLGVRRVGPAEPVSALPHRGVTAEQTSCCSG